MGDQNDRPYGKPLSPIQVADLRAPHPVLLLQNLNNK
jgi:hypothetical protein